MKPKKLHKPKKFKPVKGTPAAELERNTRNPAERLSKGLKLKDPFKVEKPAHLGEGGGPQTKATGPLPLKDVDPVSFQAAAEQKFRSHQFSEGMGIVKGEHGIDTAADLQNLGVVQDALGPDVGPNEESEPAPANSFASEAKFQQQQEEFAPKETDPFENQKPPSDWFTQEMHKDAFHDAMYGDNASPEPEVNPQNNTQQPPDFQDLFPDPFDDPFDPFKRTP